MSINDSAVPTVCRDANEVGFRVLDQFPEPEFAQLAAAAFSDFGTPSQQLAEVLSAEAAVCDGSSKLADPPTLRIGAFRDGRLIGWTLARAVAGNDLTMVNSGVAPGERRQGIYARLVELTIKHATVRGYRSISSRHVPMHNGVIIAKLRLGFQVSGFEYSEVYGPLVCLRYLVSATRQQLYRVRAMPIVQLAASADGA